MPMEAEIKQMQIVNTLVAWVAICGCSMGVRDAVAQMTTAELRALPLLQQKSFLYVGGFRVPASESGISRFAYGGTALAFHPNDSDNPDDDSLFMSGHVHQKGAVAEISIPKPVDSEDVTKLNTAKVLQPFADITEGRLNQVGKSVALGGLLVHKNQLIWSGFNVYDANYSAKASHGTSSTKLSEKGEARGMFSVGSLNPGYVAGYMAEVPKIWQSKFGPALTGQSNLNIITRTSAGPALVGFDPSQFESANAAIGLPLLFYTVSNPLGGGMETQNPWFNYNSSIGGVVFPEDSRSIVFFGGHATGKWCYGTGEHCQDPIRGGKGNHDVGGNYVYQAWAYDAADLMAVATRRVAPWKVAPYAVWRPTFPKEVKNARIGGVAYDPITQRVFVTQLGGDPGKYEATPLIHVFKVELPKQQP